MILTAEKKRERVGWMREQALWIQREAPEHRSTHEVEWLRWVERRIPALLKEDTP